MTTNKPIAKDRVNVSTKKEKRSNLWIRAKAANQKANDAKAAALHTPQDYTPPLPPGIITSLSTLAATLGIAHLIDDSYFDTQASDINPHDYSHIEALDPSSLLDNPDAED